MDKFLEKISSYNIFNYLLPGVVFTIFFQKITNLVIFQNNPIVDAFLVYFIGLVISRVGSLCVEPILEKLKLINQRTEEGYAKYVKATQKDPKIDILSEQNNMYRTFISMFILLFIAELYIKISHYFQWSNTTNFNILSLILIIIFILSFRKQNNKYISNRVAIANKGDDK